MLTDSGSKALISAILKQAYHDYTQTEQCQQFCERYEICEGKNTDSEHCDAKKFLHSAWCASLVEGAEMDYTGYVMGMMDRCKLTKNTFKYLEGELRAYKSNCRELDRLKDEIINRTPVKQEGHGYSVSDPTQRTVMAMMTNNRLQRMEKTIAAIKDVYDNCDRRKQDLIKELYWQNKYTVAGMVDMFGVDPATIWRWKKQIVYALAVKLGYL